MYLKVGDRVKISPKSRFFRDRRMSQFKQGRERRLGGNGSKRRLHNSGRVIEANATYTVTEITQNRGVLLKGLGWVPLDCIVFADQRAVTKRHWKEHVEATALPEIPVPGFAGGE